MLLNIERSEMDGGITLVRLTGRIVQGRECQELEWLASDFVREGKTRVIADMSGVSHLDSTGIGILVMCSGKLKEAGGNLHLAGARGIVDHTLTITTVNKIIPMFGDVAAAAAAFANAAGA